MAGNTEVPGGKGGVVDLAAFDAGVFDLDGVITRTAHVHAAAWKRLFDEYLQRRATQRGEAFRPFELPDDYLQHVDGKPRYDGVRDFLQARGIVLPDGTPDDPPEHETVCGLGNRKNALFRELLAQLGVEVFDSSIAFIRALREAGLKTAVVSSSENTVPILDAAGLTELFDARVDGIDAARLGLKGKPAPDTFLHAARMLGVAPERAFGVEDSLAGVEAIRAAGYGRVVGVDRAGHTAALSARGADVVVPDLDALRLRPAAAHAATRTPAAAGTVAAPASVEFPVTPTADPEWVLVEEGFTLTREHEVESLFAIGNGYVGTRGSLAEGSTLSAPATFVAGVFDSESGAPPGLATVPDWSQLSVTVEGQPLRLDTGNNLENRRILDMRQAILWREWRHQDDAGRISNIHGLRLNSAADRHLLIQSITFAPENYSGVVNVATSIGGALSKRTATGVTLAMASATRLLDTAGRVVTLPDPTPTHSVSVELGNVYRLDRIIAVHTSRVPGDPHVIAREHADRAIQVDLATLVDGHCRAWSERWDASDIRIEGDPAAQRALRFAIYHLLSAANPQDDRVSIGARALTGGAYQGHVFWDTEIFMLPFFTLTWPEAARALLGYRHHALPAARRRAVRFGYRGALYAWESADTGEDVTPARVILPSGELTPVLTGEQEQHISADIAYGTWWYWRASGDDDFLRDAGAEIILETARFWASRTQREADGRQHIHDVIGPDEYHETVDDNAYTNGMAKWNLLAAERVARLVAEQWPAHWEALSARLGLRAEEPGEWRDIACDMYTGLDAKTGLIEQFRGYFDLEDMDLSAFEPRTAPIDMLLGRERVQQSQLIKQADVVMLLHLLWDDYPPQVRERNFRYYEPRCGHGSSLSPAIHALVAARLGDVALAMRYFRQAMDIDLADNMGNAAKGVHAAALGGLWQAVVFGFAGLRFGEQGPEPQPHLPPQWRGLAMRLQWRGQAHELKLSADGAMGADPGGRRHE